MLAHYKNVLYNIMPDEVNFRIRVNLNLDALKERLNLSHNKILFKLWMK